MPRYSVAVSCEIYYVYDIEADSQTEAEKIACEYFQEEYHPYEITHCESEEIEDDEED